MRRLVAKKGAINVYHFAHEDDSDCPGAYETSLHLAAKSILVAEKRVRIPPFNIGFGIGSQTQIIHFDNIKDETHLQEIRPDILAYKNGHPLIIEIKVTHAIDNTKLQKIKTAGISAIEIDLSNANPNELQCLTQAVIDDLNNRQWLFNVHQEEYKTLLIQERKKSFLPAWWYECDMYVWHCPKTGRIACCTDCPDKMEYEQRNYTSEDYKQDPDFIYCRTKLNGR